jgi:hypothetical protein
MLLLTMAILAASCSSTGSSGSTGDAIIAGTADTAYVVSDVGQAVFFEFPKFVIWTVPKAVVYDFPRSTIIMIRGYRAKVEELVGTLEAGGLTLEEQVEISEELGELTGLPIHSSERWIEWWKGAKDVSERKWREAFVLASIDDLTSEDYFTRVTAIEDLKSFFGTTLGYDPKGTESELADGAARWRGHLAKNGMPLRKQS